MARKQTLYERLDDLVEQFAPELREAFRAAISDVVDNVVIKDLVEAIENGDPIRAYQILGFSDAAMSPLTAVIERLFETGGVTVGSTFPRLLNTATGRGVYRFDVRNSRAEKWLRERSASLVVKIQDDTATALRNILTDGMAAGRNPNSVAKDIVGRINPLTNKREGGIVGLTPRFERAVARSREELTGFDYRYFNRERRDKRFDSIVKKAFAEKRPLTVAEVEKLSGRYADRLLQLRGETIARTEAIASLNQAEHEAVKQAVDMGAVKQKNIKRIWDSAGDDGRTRKTHLELDGQIVEMDQPFVSDSGARMMYPGDTSLGAPGEETINCRCKVRMKIDWLADVK